jgi:hypothetical protein
MNRKAFLDNNIESAGKEEPVKVKSPKSLEAKRLEKIRLEKLEAKKRRQKNMSFIQKLIDNITEA